MSLTCSQCNTEVEWDESAQYACRDPKCDDCGGPGCFVHVNGRECPGLWWAVGADERETS